ncbi:hypothetical protein Agub_g6096, partial [Astrephomene gubernaculifera]
MAAAAKKLLFAAAEAGDLAKLQQALAAGAPVDARNSEGCAALHLAAAAGHAPLVRALLAAGAKSERRREEDERTALHLAAEEGHLEVVCALLAGGADVAATDIDLSTPLHLAAHFGDAPVVEALLHAGAQPTARNHAGQTPLLVAAEACGCRWVGRPGCDYPGSVGMLLRAREGQEGKQEGKEATGGWEAGAGDVPAVAALAAAVAAAAVGDGATEKGEEGGEGGSGGGGSGGGCETDSSGESAAHVAVRAGNMQVLAVLCAARAGLAACGPRGVTPLHLAAAGGMEEAVRLLAGAGAPLEARELEGGLTPLHSAVQAGQLRAAEVLLEAGADPASPDSRGLTPLHTAALRA